MGGAEVMGVGVRESSSEMQECAEAWPQRELNHLLAT